MFSYLERLGLPTVRAMKERLHIALIEDNADLRLLLAQGLRSLGHTVLMHESAEDLLERRGATDIDVYLVDLNLPGEGGLSLIKRLRGVSPRCGIVVITARGDVDDRVKGYECGADLYMVKPISLAELAAVLHSLGHRRQIAHQMAPSTGVTLRLHKGRLSSPEATVRLSFDESIMLEALVKAPAQRLASWQLASLLEAQLDESFRANLAVRMARLRKKLRSLGAPDAALEPLRNHGYRLNAQVLIDAG